MRRSRSYDHRRRRGREYARGGCRRQPLMRGAVLPVGSRFRGNPVGAIAPRQGASRRLPPSPAPRSRGRGARLVRYASLGALRRARRGFLSSPKRRARSRSAKSSRLPGATPPPPSVGSALGAPSAVVAPPPPVADPSKVVEPDPVVAPPSFPPLSSPSVVANGGGAPPVASRSGGVMRPCVTGVGVEARPGALDEGAGPAAIGSARDPESNDGGARRFGPSKGGTGGPIRFGPNASGVGVGVAVGVAVGRRPDSLPGSLGGRNAGVGVGVAVGWNPDSLPGSLGGRNAGVGVGVGVGWNPDSLPGSLGGRNAGVGVGVGVGVAVGTGTSSRGGVKPLLPGGST